MKKFVARNVAEVGRDPTAAILRATNFGVDTRCNSAIGAILQPGFADFVGLIRWCNGNYRVKHKRVFILSG